MEQHKGLCKAIQDADITATVHSIALVIGVAGSIYKDISSHLPTLGVNGQYLKATIKTIHLKRTNLLHWIKTTKQKKEPSKDRKAPWKRKTQITKVGRERCPPNFPLFGSW
jgi:hypothetical protein